MLMCQWMWVEGVYQCPSCGNIAKHATTQMTCKRQPVDGESKPPPPPKPSRQCIHLGEPTSKRLNCGCPNQSPYKIHWCELLGSECAKFVDNRKINPGVLCCTTCKHKAYK